MGVEIHGDSFIREIIFVNSVCLIFFTPLLMVVDGYCSDY